MKVLNYLYNTLRLGILKIKHQYIGGILQGIPCSTVIYSGSGVLSIDGKLSSRGNSYLSSGTGKLSIGKNCFINQNAYIVSKECISIGNDVIIGPNAVIVDHDHDFRSKDYRHKFTTAPITIEDNVWLGGNVTICKGVKIGRGSVIGAGCVLNRKNCGGYIPPNSIVSLEGSVCVKSIEKRNEQ